MILRRLFKLYEADPTDLVFYLKEENNPLDVSLVGTRYEVRKKYWSFALDRIKESHGKEGSFKNVNPTKDNWINGYMGVSGFVISCVANTDEARVEIVLGKSDKDKNKDTFDTLYASKEKVESELGTKLVWLKAENIKTSRIYIRLDNVSINNENDWLQMAKFHAEWSKKFYDVFVPIIRLME